jgi:hypothetical protein
MFYVDAAHHVLVFISDEGGRHGHDVVFGGAEAGGTDGWYLLLYLLDIKYLKKKNYFVCSGTIQRSLAHFGWCKASIFSHMKIVRKDICFAPSESEFVNRI